MIRTGQIAKTLQVFVDTLLPGDDLFPAASTIGLHGLLAERIRARDGSEALATLADVLATDGKAFADLTQSERISTVRRYEADNPDSFAFLRIAASYGYYQHPLVVQAIRELGHDYNDAPQPRGYPMPPFDPTPGVNLPARPRGAYKRTEDMARVDLAGISHFDGPKDDQGDDT